MATLFRQASPTDNPTKWLSGKTVQIFIKNYKYDVLQVDSTTKTVLGDGDSSTNTIPSDDALNPKGYLSIQPGTPGSGTFETIFSPLYFRIIKQYFQEFTAYSDLVTGTASPPVNVEDWEVSLAWLDRTSNSLHILPRCKITSITGGDADTSGSNQQPMTVNYSDVGGVGSQAIDLVTGETGIKYYTLSSASNGVAAISYADALTNFTTTATTWRT